VIAFSACFGHILIPILFGKKPASEVKLRILSVCGIPCHRSAAIGGGGGVAEWVGRASVGRSADVCLYGCTLSLGHCV